MLKPNTGYMHKRAPRKYQEIARKIQSSMSSRGMRKSVSQPELRQEENSQKPAPTANEVTMQKDQMMDQGTFQSSRQNNESPIKENLDRADEESSPKTLLGYRPYSTVSSQDLYADPMYIDTKQMLRDKKINFMCRNTEDFLKEEELDIHGLSNLSDHKIIRFKYPKSKQHFHCFN